MPTFKIRSTGQEIRYNPDPVRSRPQVDKITGGGQPASPSLPTASGALRKADRETKLNTQGKIEENSLEKTEARLRTLMNEAEEDLQGFRADTARIANGIPITNGGYQGKRYRTIEEAEEAYRDFKTLYDNIRNRYYVEENEQQQARLAGDTSMQASFARADEIRGALNRIQTLEQTRAAAPGPMTEDAVSQAVREIAGEYGLSQEDGRNLTTVRKALESRLLEETDRISAAGYDYERMTEYQKRQERAAEAEQQRRQTAAWAGEHPVLASIASVGASALQAVDIPRLIATGGGSEDDLRTYTPADPNAAIISNFVTGVRDTVSKKIEENTDWELFGQNVASFLYNTGMSIGDSASQVAVLGPWATYLMGASAASQQAVNVLERGGSNSQAFWGGLAAGAAEAVFERFSIEKLLEAKTINSVKDLLRETAKQAGTEASEEMLTEVANILSDTAIMGESSDFEQLVTQYQLMGMNEDEARKQAYLDSVVQVVWAGVGGALSGMAMGGATSGVDLAGRTVQQRQQQTTSRAIDDAYATMRREGLFSPAARQAAGQAQQRIGAADRRDARAFNNNYYGQPRLPELRPAQEHQNQEQPAEQRPQDTPAAVNVAELEQSAAAAGAAEADTRAAAEISQVLGREIRFYNGAQRQDPSARANGYFDGDTIYVNSRSANPVAQIISHELTHSVEMADAYQDLSSLVFDRIQRTGGDLEQLRQEKQTLYAANGVSLASQEMIDQEIVAEYVEQNLLTNEQEILDLTRENPTLGQRILDWIDRILARLGNSSAQERAFLTTARDTYARALEQTRTSQEAGQQQSTQQTAPPAAQTAPPAAQTAAPAAQTAPAGQRTERQTEPQEQGQEAAPRQQETRPEPETEPAAPEADQERQRRREEIRQEVRTLREDYAAGRISDEEFDEALDAIMEEEGLEDVSMLGRYSFGGENARRAELDTLDRAKEMERQGVAMETIFRETGWYTGADGKWRFEIDDSGMEYSRWGDLNRSDRAEYARFRELEGKFIDGSITLEEQNELRQLIDQGHGPGRAEEQQTLQLSDFVRHDELYRNYPQLRQAGLRFADLPDGTSGSYNPGANVITLDNSLRSSPEDTLVHEIQHAIQTAEGFSGGSSPAYWARREYETGDFVSDRLQREYDQILNGLGREDRNRYTRYTELGRELESLAAAESDTEAGRRYDRLEAEQDTIYEELYPNEWFRQLLDLSRRMEDTAGEYRRMYQNTAGEIEARDVTARRQLTPEQRRQTMPNTGDENTVFAEAGDSYSVQEPTDAQQEEADRLFFQGVDADTIREMTGLERMEDGSWRTAVDTVPAAAYDGGRTTDQQGGRDDGSEVERDAGGVLRAQNRRSEAMDAGVRGEGGQTNGGIQEEPGQRAGVPGWARGRLIDRPSAAAGIAAENAGRYGADAFVVDDAAIKKRSPGAWALTSGGRIYISDSIPAELADVVGYHEAVHAAKQNENESYLELLNRTDDEVSFGSQKAQDVINLLAGRRFNGADFLSLDDSQVKTVLDELNALVWGFHKADPENARAQFADMFRDYDAYIADLDSSMESGAADGDARYSMDEDTQAEPSDNPLPSLDQDETQGAEQSYFDTLPRKVRNYLEGTERRLLNQLGDSLSVPRTARREYLKGITRQLTEEYLQQGRVSQETIDRLFDEAYKESKDAIRSYYNENQNLRDYLRSTKVEFSQEDVAEIPNLNDIAGRNAGILNISI